MQTWSMGAPRPAVDVTVRPAIDRAGPSSFLHFLIARQALNQALNIVIIAAIDNRQCDLRMQRPDSEYLSAFAFAF